MFVSVVKLTVIFLGLREIIYGYTEAVIFTFQVTLSGVEDCQFMKHVTLKNLVKDDIFISNKLKVLTSYCCLRQNGEGRVEYKQRELKILIARSP